jgi:cell division protein FtsW (lipid II flippase)
MPRPTFWTAPTPWPLLPLVTFVVICSRRYFDSTTLIILYRIIVKSGIFVFLVGIIVATSRRWGTLSPFSLDPLRLV